MRRMQPRMSRLLPALLLCLSCMATAAFAARKTQPDHWVGTWATSPVAEPNGAGSNQNGLAGSVDLTDREIVHVSAGGALVRIVLTNEFGTQPLTIAAAHIALSAGHGDISLATANALTFSGNPSVTIPAGGMVVSDPAGLKLPAFADLAVSLFVPAQPISHVTLHTFADQTSYTAPGNVVGAHTLRQPTEIHSWPFLKGVDVLLSPDSASIVAFGDSITDGALSTQDANARWPDVLAHRLGAKKKTGRLGVLNEGIGGNRVLHDGTGPSALARFDRDVLAQAGVRYLILMEGINDIGNAQNPNHPVDVVTAEDLIAGLDQLAARAHIHNIKVIGATLTPYVGAGYASPAGEAMRQAVNQWIRTSKDLDGVIDFDKAIQNPANPAIFNPAADSGDHLHPNDAGYKMMGNAIDLNLFTPAK